jgi:beta-N-acetylhexosaminidase
MTAHVMYPAWDEESPATMSSRIIRGVLREKFGFQGVVFSDDMEMKAVRGRYALETQLEASTLATVDVYLFCKEIELQVQAYELLVHQQEADKRLEDLAIDATRRWHGLRERFLVDRSPQPELAELGSVANRDLAFQVRARGQA